MGTMRFFVLLAVCAAVGWGVGWVIARVTFG